MESDERIYETQWEELNDNLCYYTGSNWYYTSGYVTHGDSAYITWIDQDTYRVGGETYTGVNKESSWENGKIEDSRFLLLIIY